MATDTRPFTVAAGKYDGFDRNCKYIEDFATLDDAIEALRRVTDYPWAHIEYRGTSTRDARIILDVTFPG